MCGSVRICASACVAVRYAIAVAPTTTPATTARPTSGTADRSSIDAPNQAAPTETVRTLTVVRRATRNAPTSDPTLKAE